MRVGEELDSALSVRLSPEGLRLLRRSRTMRIWGSSGFVVVPLILFPVLAVFRAPASATFVAAIAYVLIGVPALVVVMVFASRESDRAARVAGEHLNVRQYTSRDAIPKVLLRMPIEGVDSWLAVNHIPNPAQIAMGETNEPDRSNPGHYRARWTEVIAGGSIAMVGVILALWFVALQIVSLVRGVPASSWAILLVFLCVCCFAVGLPVMYRAARKVARLRAQWYQGRSAGDRT